MTSFLWIQSRIYCKKMIIVSITQSVSIHKVFYSFHLQSHRRFWQVEKQWFAQRLPSKLLETSGIDLGHLQSHLPPTATLYLLRHWDGSGGGAYNQNTIFKLFPTDDSHLLIFNPLQIVLNRVLNYFCCLNFSVVCVLLNFLKLTLAGSFLNYVLE